MDPSLFNNQGGQFYYMKKFHPSSTPKSEFSNPGTCNVKLHTIFTPLLFRSTEKVVAKETVSATTLLPSTIQKGGSTSDDVVEMFKYPIKVSKTLLLQTNVPKEENLESKTDQKTEKKRSLPTNKSNSKKKKFSLNIMD